MLSHLHHVLLRKSHIQRPQVFIDVFVMHALWYDHRAPVQTPGEHRLRDRRVLGLGHHLPERVVEDHRDVRVVVRIRIGQWGVGDDLDSPAEVPVDKVLLLEVRMSLELVRVGADFACSQYGVDFGGGKVGHANVSRLVIPHEILQGPPGIDKTRFFVEAL